MSAGAGLVGLWGDVLSTHCEEAGDVISRRVNWPSAIWLADSACVSAPRRISLHKYWASVPGRWIAPLGYPRQPRLEAGPRPMT